MATSSKSPKRNFDTPRDKPVSERTEHANHERPGAQAHPVARGWTHLSDPALGWGRR